MSTTSYTTYNEKTMYYIDESTFYETIKDVTKETEILTEAYYGRPEPLIEAEGILNRMVEAMKLDPSGDYTNSPENKELCSLLKKQFGFKNVAIIWKRSPGYAPTLGAMLSAYVITHGSSSFVINQKKGYYNKKHDKSCIIYASSTLPRQCGCTGEEYLAAILHEVGHCFDASPYAVVGFISNYITSVMNALVFGGPIPALSSMISLSQPGTNLGAWVRIEIEKILNLVPPLKKITIAFRNVCSQIVKAAEILMAPVASLAFPIEITLSPIVHLLQIPTRKAEIFADSFAAAYGYAAPLASMLTRLDRINLLKNDASAVRADNCVIRLGKDIALAQREFLNATVNSSHGTTDSRIADCITALEADIKTGGYPPEIVSEIRAEIRRLQNDYNNYMKCGKNEKLVVSQFTREAVTAIYGKHNDAIHKLFPNIIV